MWCGRKESCCRFFSQLWRKCGKTQYAHMRYYAHAAASRPRVLRMAPVTWIWSAEASGTRNALQHLKTTCISSEAIDGYTLLFSIHLGLQTGSAKAKSSVAFRLLLIVRDPGRASGSAGPWGGEASFFHTQQPPREEQAADQR
jgi:hypothetical protein